MKSLARAVARAPLVVALLALVAAAWAWLPVTRPGARVSVLVMPAPDEARLTQKRIASKDDVADRLTGGELSLLEAAAWFRQINDTAPRSGADFRRYWPGDSDGEKACRQVISWVHTVTLTQLGQSQADLAAGSLERELDAILAAGSGVELPW